MLIRGRTGPRFMFSAYDANHLVVGRFIGMRRGWQIRRRRWRLAFDPPPSVGMERQGVLIIGIAYFVWFYLDGIFFDLDFVGVGLSRGRACFLKQESMMIESGETLD